MVAGLLGEGEGGVEEGGVEGGGGAGGLMGFLALSAEADLEVHQILF